MTDQTAEEQIVRYLWSRFPRARGFDPLGRYPDRPTKEELAQELVSDAEFKALQLGTWLGTTEGEVISAAVLAVFPYGEDAQLLIDALKYAAKIEHKEKRNEATGKLVIGAGLVTLLVIVLRSDRAIAG